MWAINTAGQETPKKTKKLDSLQLKPMKQINLEEVILVTPRLIKLKSIGELKVNQIQLAKEMISDVRDLVRYMPGVGISYSSSRGGTRGFAIRGVEANRVAISIDGVQQPEIHENLVFSAYGLSNASRIEFDPYFVSMVSIKKGASSFSKGSGALGGAVNYKTKRASDLIKDNKNFGINLQTHYNGKDNLKMYLFGVGAKHKKWETLLMFSDRYGEQIRNFEHGELKRNVTSTRVDPMKFNKQALLVKVGYAPNSVHKVGFSYHMLHKKVDSEIWSQEPLDIFTVDGKPYYYADDQTLSHSFSLGYTFSPKNSWLKKTEISTNVQNTFFDARTWSEYYRPNFYDNGKYRLIYEGRRDKYRGQEISDKRVDLKSEFREYTTEHLGKHRFTLIGAIANKYNENRNVDVENPVASNEVDGYTVRFGNLYDFGEPIGKLINVYSFQRPIIRTNYSVSLLDEIKINSRLSFTVGLRYDNFHTEDEDWNYDNDQDYLDYLMRNLQNVEINNSPISSTDEGLSYLATANYRIGDNLNIGYKFSTGFRVPTTEEKYFQYFNSWPSFLVLSNRSLKPETSTNHEFEITSNGSYGSFMINLYRSGYNDFIDVERGTLEVTDELDNATKEVSYVKNINQESANLYGLDAKLDLDLKAFTTLLTGFRANIAASYAKGETSKGTSMLGVQPLTGILGLEYQPLNQNWSVNLSSRYYKAKNSKETRFVENTVTKEVIRSFPSIFLEDAMVFDLYGHYRINSHFLVRFGVNNLLNKTFWRWDDLRQLTNPALLPHIDNFFREGKKTITRFSQPKRYVSMSLEFEF